MDVEVLYAVIDYNFLLGRSWIHAMMAIMSLVPQVIWFPQWGKIVMIDQLDYCMLETFIQSNVPFIRDSLKEFQNIRVRSLRNDSLMGNFVILQPLSAIEVSYQDIEMDLVDLDQNIPLMEEYDPVTWPILAVRPPKSLYFLHRILSSHKTTLETINIWLCPPKDIFCGATASIFGLNPPKYRSILCMFLDIIRYIWKHAYRFRLSLCEYESKPFATQIYHRV